MFEVKFGTPKPIMFREYCVYGDNILDIDLEARFAGKCEVSEYDGSRYGNDEEVSLFIKQSCSEILEKCLDLVDRCICHVSDSECLILKIAVSVTDEVTLLTHSLDKV